MNKLAGAAAAATLVAISGSAFTAANGVAGYGTSTVSGATATKVTYTLNGDGTQISLRPTSSSRATSRPAPSRPASVPMR